MRNERPDDGHTKAWYRFACFPYAVTKLHNRRSLPYPYVKNLRTTPGGKCPDSFENTVNGRFDR